eukprot:UN08213
MHAGPFYAHNIISLHELCHIFTNFYLTTEKSLKDETILSSFSSHQN